MTKSSVVKLEDVWVSYHETLALRGVDMEIEDGEFLGLIGPNGGRGNNWTRSVYKFVDNAK